MTNGEMIQKVFNCEVCEPIIEDDIIHVIFADKKNSAIGFDWSWWNAEYKEPTIGVDCISRTRAIERLKLNFPISQGADNSRDRHRYMQALADLQAIKELPSVTPQLSSGLDKNSKKLEKTTTKNDLGVDCTPNTNSFKEMMDNLKITAEDIENAEDLEYSIEPLCGFIDRANQALEPLRRSNDRDNNKQ